MSPVQNSPPLIASAPVVAPVRRSVSHKGGRKRAGVTLLEAIGFLTVATIIIASTLGIYDQAQLQLRTHRTITAVAMMHIFIRGLYTNSNEFGTSLNEQIQDIIVDANGVSHGMLIEADGGGRYTLRTAFGGQVQLRVGSRIDATTTRGDTTHFFIAAEDLANRCLHQHRDSIGRRRVLWIAILFD